MSDESKEPPETSKELTAGKTFRVTVLGSGNAFATDGRGNACYLVETDKTRFLVDCGPTVLQKAESYNVDLRKIDTVFLTHFHGDHAIGLPFLMLFMKYIEGRKDPITIIGPAGVRQWVDYAMELCYPEVGVPFKVYYEEFAPGERDTMFFLDIEAIPISHKEESLGYRIGYKDKTIAFSGDSEWHRSLMRLVNGTDLAFVECSSVKKLDAKHISLEEITESELNFLHGSRQIVLTHLYNEVQSAIEESDLPYLAAGDGSVYSV